MRRLLDREGLPAGGKVHVDLVMGVPGGMPGAARLIAPMTIRAIPPVSMYAFEDPTAVVHVMAKTV